MKPCLTCIHLRWGELESYVEHHGHWSTWKCLKLKKDLGRRGEKMPDKCDKWKEVEHG